MLIFLFVQYLLAAININVAHLTILANTSTIVVNSGLLVTWVQAMAGYINERWVKFIRSITFYWLSLFTLLSITTWIGALCIESKFKSSYDNCDDCTAIDAMLIVWWITLVIAMAANLFQAILVAMLRCTFSSEAYKQERRLLGYLSLTSLFFAMNNLSVLLKAPPLDFISYSSSHLIFMQMCKPIADTRHKSNVSNV
jgi:hypothetical protein